MKNRAWCGFWAVGALAAFGLVTRDARACGGFFCSQAQPVNQAAERIIFADNGDGTVTAVIQIMYEGPSESFSWLLPISTAPEGDDLGVASDLAFQRLQAATNPTYSLTTRVEGECKQDEPDDVDGGFAGDSAGGESPNAGGAGGSGPVTVEGSGVVGPYDWTAISVDPDLPAPADAAIAWLEDNGYDVGEGAPGLIGPYLADGNLLLALQLTKGADTGSIRPLMLTYDADLPMIPIKLTAVAANENMGVMTWLLSSSRGVPLNYAALELNEARINWFNASLNYADVVNAAADEGGGQGFVTEFAGETTALSQVVWTDYDEANWQYYQGDAVFSSFEDIFWSLYYSYGEFDGFWDAIAATVTLPEGTPFSDFRACPDCYASMVEFSPTALLDAMERMVIAPFRDVQALLDRHAYVTRLYTTMSAAEMTVDPIFGFNPDLDDVSNIHVAERVIECNPDVYQFEAPYRIELPQGGFIRGTPDTFGQWPAEVDAQPANQLILRTAESGEPLVLEDNSEQILNMLDEYNDSFGAPNPSGSGGTGSGGRASGGSPETAGSPDGGAAPGEGGSPASGGNRTSGGSRATGGSGPGSGDAGSAGDDGGTTGSDSESGLDDSGCSLSVGARGAGPAWLWGGLGALVWLARRRRRAPLR